MGGGGRVLVRRLEAHEAALHRDLRLRALGDAPESFGETVAEAAARAPAYWEDLTRSVTEPGRHVMFLTCEGQDPVGSRSPAAIALYSRAGFRETGTRRPLAPGSRLEIVEMGCPL